ncbi:hypothetical protein EfsSVR2331_06460 [Enterococcus faecalis]|nr:hypothetical protein EfsSVR2331_06460 [Enterococcus faecalis]
MIEVIQNIMIRIIMIIEFAWKHKIGTAFFLLLFFGDSISYFFFRVLLEAIFELLLEVIESITAIAF